MKLKVIFALILTTLVSVIQKSHADREQSHPCSINLKSYKTQGTLAEFTLSVQCTVPDIQPDTDKLPPRDIPLLIGLSALVGTQGNAESDYDFAVQNFTLAEGTDRQFTFRAQASDLGKRKYIETRIWPLHYLQDCSEGRSGCVKYGYALGKPEKQPDYCSDDEPLCGPSERYEPIKFR